MAIVNMCNFTHDFKEILISKNGLMIIMDLLRNKDEIILINTLRLVMSLITQTDSESNLSRIITETNDHEIIRQLIRMIKFGPNI